MLRRKSRPDCLIAAAAAAKSPPQLSSPSVMSTTDAAAGGSSDRRSPAAPSRRAASRRAASPCRSFQQRAAIDLLHRLHELRVGARFLLFRSVPIAVDAQADVEVVGHAFDSTSCSTVRAVAIRVLLPSGRFIEPDRSRMISRFLRDCRGRCRDRGPAHRQRVRSAARAIVRHRVPVAPAAVPRTANAIGVGDRRRRRQRERRRRLLRRASPSRDRCGPKTSRAGGRRDRQRDRARVVRLRREHRERIRDRLAGFDRAADQLRRRW